MNRNKNLVKWNNVPNTITMEDVCEKVSALMSFTFLGAKDLAGILIQDEDHQDNKTIFLYFLQKKNIDQFRTCCKRQDNKYILYGFNTQMEIEFPSSRNVWNLSSLENPRREEDFREIRVSSNKFQDICFFMDKLPHNLKIPSSVTKIQSIVQSKDSTYIKFASDEDAARAKRVFENDGLNVVYSVTYMCICQEIEDEEIQANSNPIEPSTSPSHIQNSTHNDPIIHPQKIPTSSHNTQDLRHRLNRKTHTAKVLISNQPASPSPKTISLGMISMKELTSIFETNETIHLSLQAAENTNPDEDVVVISENVDIGE